MGSTHSDSSILVASDDPNFSVGDENTSVNFSDDLKNANTLWVDLPARRMWGWTKVFKQFIIL